MGGTPRPTSFPFIKFLDPLLLEFEQFHKINIFSRHLKGLLYVLGRPVAGIQSDFFYSM